MKYDIISKLWIEQFKEFLPDLLGGDLKHCEPLEDLQQELPAIYRADYISRVVKKDGGKEILLLELLTRWSKKKLLSLLCYDCHCLIKYELPTRPIVLLFLPNTQASEVFENDHIFYKCRLVRVWELDAQAFFRKGIPELYPWIPLMKGGVEIAEEVSAALLSCGLPAKKKGDLLAIYTTLLGLRDEGKAATVLAEGKDRMNVLAESPIFERILEMGRKEGTKKALSKGQAQGLVEGLRRALKASLEAKFGPEAFEVFPVLDKCRDAKRLESTIAGLASVKSIKEFQRLFSR